MDRLASLLTEINPTIVRALHESEKLTALKIRSERRADLQCKRTARPAFIINNALSTTAELPSYHFQRKIPSHRLHLPGYLRRHVTNINIIQYGHGNILKSGLKGIQIIMFSRVAYVGCSTSADKNTI